MRPCVNPFSALSTLLVVLAVLLHLPAFAATFVSFQEGDVRTGAGREAVNTNGTLVTNNYNMGGVYVRTDSPTVNKDGTNIIAGTQGGGNTMRTLLSFNLSSLTNVVGTNFARIDSVALILTHDTNVGTGTGAVYSVHLTRSFNETNATWNNPHGDSLDAGGYVGTKLRERLCVGTNVTPVKETFASPASYWTDGGSGPDLLAQAVRESMTNASKTIYLLVKRTNEAAADHFIRLKHDNDSAVDYRPELLVGIDSTNGSIVTVSVTASDPTASEPGFDTGTFTLTRTGAATNALTVAFTLGGSATPGSDYTISPASPVTFTAGVSNVTLTVTALNDALVEGNETVVLSLQADAAYVIGTGSATITILDDDMPYALAAYGFNENSSSAASLAEVAVASVFDSTRIFAGNATAGVGLGQFGPGTDTANTHGYGTGGYVSPPTGFYVRGSVTSSTLSDSLAADDYLSFTVGPRIGSAIDFRSVSARVKLQAVTNLTGTVVVRSSQDGFLSDLATLVVNGNTSANTFSLLSNNITGAAFTAVVQPIEFRFYLYDGTDSTGEFIRLDDVLFFGTVGNLPAGIQLVTLTASDPTAMESGGDTGAFQLQRIGDTNGALAISYAISGSASNGLDYQWLGGVTNFAPGVTNLIIPVNPINDFRAEPPETVVLTVNTNSGFILVGPSSATVTIVDDNDPPEFVVNATTPLAYEPVAAFGGVFTVTRSLGDISAAVTVQMALSGTASNNVDYVASATNVISFAAGQMSRTVVITPIDDALFESPETVVLSLLPGSGYSIGTPDTATVTIFDDEGVANASLFIEAESFTNIGGWLVDQQFVDLMGSPYLLAHGKGHPVLDATTVAQFPVTGAYRMWVRNKDWTAPLSDHPGSFKVSIGGVEVAPTFGTVGQGWLWQDGGMVMVTNATTEIRLHDLTGFDGRCDALFFTTDPTVVPTNAPGPLAAWRRAQSGLADVPPSAGNFDLVVVGGGIAGSCAAIAAARQGLQVALIHDRPVPGGNASQDVRVHTLGVNPGGIVGEINTPDYLIGSDQFLLSDQRRMLVLLGESNLHLFTEWRAFAVQTNGTHIISVDAKHTRSGEERRFTAPVFIDSTGDGWIGYWAGALYRRGREARAEFNESLAPTNNDLMTMGTTLSWNSKDVGHPYTFPAVTWATNVSKDYVATRGDWWWEYGLVRDTVYDAEEIRDHLLQAIYGSFANAKKTPSNANRDLDWVAYIGGKRESRRFIGDHTLVESDVRKHAVWPDSVVREARDIDIHFPSSPIYDWQTYAQFTPISDYWIPFRCLYSTNIDNLMMAGRCLSATHVGLGSPRVMNTCGQMGVAVGNAAALCKKYNASPRGVAQRFTAELQQLIGITRYFDTPSNTVSIVDNADPDRVELTGVWNRSTALPGYYGPDFLDDGNTNKGLNTVCFRPDVPMTGNYRVYFRWTVAADRSDRVPVDIICGNGRNTVYPDETFGSGSWMLLGTFPFDFGNAGSILVRTTNTFATVAVDAVALASEFALDPGFTGTPWQDDDGDGVFNYVEYLNGTNPRDGSSCVRIRFTAQSSNASLRFPVMAGKSYQVQYCEALGSNSWLTLTNVSAGAFTREVEIQDSQPAPDGTRFYRLVSY